MDYGSLIERAWRLTWRNRFLWVLGLFATSTVGSCSPANGGAQWQLDPSEIEGLYSPDLARSFQEAEPWLSQNVAPILLSIAIAAFLIGIVFFVVSLAAQGGMAAATGELAQGRTITGREAWRTGFQLFWRYLLLWLILLVLFIAVIVAAVVVVGVGVAIAALLQGEANALVAIVGVLVGIPAVLLGIAIFTIGSVIVGFAQRAIAIEGVQAGRSLQVGYRLVRRNLGTSALAWLVGLATGIVAGIGIALVAAVLLLPLGGIGLGIYAATGISTSLFIYGTVAVLILMGGLWFASGVVNAYFWNYWTLVYLRLTGRITERLEPVTGE